MEEIRVILVDDNAELRRTMKAGLERQEGIRVCAECGNGLEALEAMGKYRADVMVMDIIMPQMDGYCCLEEMQRQQPEHMPQTIVISALGRDDFIARAVDLGARYYMVKPFDMPVLVNRIREICGAAPQVSFTRPAVTGRPDQPHHQGTVPRHRAAVQHLRQQGGASHPPRHRGGLEPWTHRDAEQGLRLPGGHPGGQAHQRRVHRHDC